MSDRRSTPNEAGDDDPTPPRGTRAIDRVVDEDQETSPDEWDDGEWDEPNYLIRRAIVVGAVVVSIAIVAVVVSWFIGDDDSSSTTTGNSAEWDTLVVLDDDQVRLVARDSGDEIDTFTAGIDLLDAQTLVADNVLVTMTEEGRVSQTLLADGSQRRGLTGPDETLQISADNPAIAISASNAGGDVTVLDTRDRSFVSIADVAGLDNPLIFGRDVLVNPAGTHVAAPVPSEFQSVIIDLENNTSQRRPGRVIAIDDQRLVTEQPAGDESEVEFFDLTGERLGSVDVPAPRASLLRDDGLLLTVAANGEISLVDADGAVDAVGELIDPDGRIPEVEAGIRAANGDRLVVISARNVYVLDTDGDQLGVAPGELATEVGGQTSCAVVAAGAPQPATLLDLASGDAITEIDGGAVVGADSFDGCTVSLMGDEPSLVTDGEMLTVEADAIDAVAPDGQGYVSTDGRDSAFVALGGDPIEIADGDIVVRFGQRE